MKDADAEAPRRTRAALAVNGNSEDDPQSAGSGLTRVTVNLHRKALNALESVSEATGYSKTDTINRALLIYAIVREIMERDGGVLRIPRENGGADHYHILGE